jgi:hypothetical protein
MEASSELLSVRQLLALKAANPDIFYQVLLRLTNSQLTRLCQKDPKNRFCNNPEFWQGLWRARNREEPPKLTWQELREKYRDANRFESLVEEIADNPEMSQKLHSLVFSQYNGTGQETPEDYQKQIDQNFEKHWDRDRIRQILTKTYQRRGDEPPFLEYFRPLLETAFYFENEELLIYLAKHPAVRLAQFSEFIFDKSSEKEDQAAVQWMVQTFKKIKNLASLPLFQEMSLSEAVNFESVAKDCSGDFIRAFFERMDEAQKYEQIAAFLMSRGSIRKLQGQDECAGIKEALAEAILSLSDQNLVKIRNHKVIQAGPFQAELVRPEEVEKLLTDPSSRKEFIQALLLRWDIDRVSLLRELMETNQWPAFRQILAAMAELNLTGKETKENRENEEYQADLYQLYRDFVAGRYDRHQAGIHTWLDSGHVADDVNYDIFFLQALSGPYFAKAVLNFFQDHGSFFIKTLHYPYEDRSQRGFSYPAFENWPNTRALSEDEIEEIFDKLRKIDSRKAKIFQDFFSS